MAHSINGLTGLRYARKRGIKAAGSRSNRGS